MTDSPFVEVIETERFSASASAVETELIVSAIDPGSTGGTRYHVGVQGRLCSARSDPADHSASEQWQTPCSIHSEVLRD